MEIQEKEKGLKRAAEEPLSSPEANKKQNTEPEEVKNEADAPKVTEKPAVEKPVSQTSFFGSALTKLQSNGGFGGKAFGNTTGNLFSQAAKSTFGGATFGKSPAGGMFAKAAEKLNTGGGGMFAKAAQKLAKGSTGFPQAASNANKDKEGEDNVVTPIFGTSDKTDAETETDATKAMFGKQTDTDTGEEKESHLLQVPARLYCFVNVSPEAEKESTSTEDEKGTTKDETPESQESETKKGEKDKAAASKPVWRERGRGLLTVNQSKENETTSRLVMRQDRNKRLVLNAPIWDGISPKILPPKSLRIQAVNDATNSKKIEVFLISSSKKDVEQLEKVINSCVDKKKKGDQADKKEGQDESK
eukprot:m.38562 g.38562  ORF g.38562 m.38562 type:complete len:360 (+) comp9450_c0_seq1:101-1180(+)